MFQFFREKNIKKDRKNKTGALTSGLVSKSSSTVKSLRNYSLFKVMCG